MDSMSNWSEEAWIVDVTWIVDVAWIVDVV